MPYLSSISVYSECAVHMILNDFVSFWYNWGLVWSPWALPRDTRRGKLTAVTKKLVFDSSMFHCTLLIVDAVAHLCCCAGGRLHAVLCQFLCILNVLFT